MIYHYPRLSAVDLGFVRSPGPGLGNLLFPISRALIGREQAGGTFVYPTMRQLKIGTFLRWEKDKRTYGDILRPRSVQERRDWSAARRQTSVPEGSGAATANMTVVYEGLASQFHDIAGNRQLIQAWLQSTMSQAPPASEPYDLAIHVRQGDFGPAVEVSDGFNTRLPFDWYKSALATASELMALNRPRIRLFTDGDPATVARQLDLQSCVVDDSRNALHAIVAMSKAKLLIGSRSTFSMWGAFLGDVPTIWDKRFPLTTVFPLRDGLDHLV